MHTEFTLFKESEGFCLLLSIRLFFRIIFRDKGVVRPVGIIDMVLLPLFSQGSSDILLGGATGWIGAGLLGLVLGWLLLKYLPAKDQQLKEFQEEKDKQIISLIQNKDVYIIDLSGKYERKLDVVITTFKLEIQETRKEFKDALAVILAHCERESAKAIETFRSEIIHIAAVIQGKPMKNP